MKFSDKLWLKWNNHSPFRYRAYIAEMMAWSIIGGFFTLGTMSFFVDWRVATFVWVWCVIGAIAFYLSDKRQGMIDALHEADVRNYENKLHDIETAAIVGLLKWFNEQTGEVSTKGFDTMYKKLMGSYPKWYTWGPFYRDHGIVGLRKGKHESQSKI